MYEYEVKEDLLRELDGVRISINADPEIALTRLDLIQLANLHKLVSIELNHFYDLEVKVTKFEHLLRNDLRSLTRYQFLPGFWIGRHCVDLFFPRYKMIVEIDGGIHNSPIKMLKDEHRDEYFKNEHGIQVTHIENENIFDFSRDLIRGLRRKEIKPIDTRSKNKMMRDIYIKTIVRHKNLLRTQMWN